MTDTTTLNDDWVDILPDQLEVDARTRPGDLIVLETRMINGQPTPGAAVRIAETTAEVTIRRKVRGPGYRETRVRFASWDRLEGEILLTNEERHRFLLGEIPRLTWPAPFECPVTLRLADDFEITIDGLERLRKPGFAPRWTPERLTIRDMRPELMLRAGVLPSTRYRKGHDDAVHGPTSLEIELAAVESAYTRDSSRSADREVSAIVPNDVGSVSRAEAFREGRRQSIKVADEEYRARHPWRAAA